MKVRFEKLEILYFSVWILSKKNSIYVIEATEDENPIDYIEDIIGILNTVDNNEKKIYIDMSKFYGKYGEWIWKCQLTLDDKNNIDDISYTSVSNVELIEVENKYLSEYIYISKNL